MTPIVFKPIGVVHTDAAVVPRHWTVSDVEGTLVIDEAYRDGLRDIRPGHKIIVLFHFHKSQPFSSQDLIQKPPHRNEHLGVFSTCSPRRPNPIGLSVVEVLDVVGSTLRVKGIDMIDGTPILDLKPWITESS